MNRLVSDQRGYILIAALVVLLLVGLLSGPVLSYVVSGLRAGHTFETGAAELYAADAGWEDAVFKIESGVGLCPGNPSKHYSIPNVNGKSVDIAIEYVTNSSGVVTYRVTSSAASEGSHTTVQSYVKFTPGGELDIFGGVLSSKGDINFISFGSVVAGDIYYAGTLDPNFDHVSGNQTKVSQDDFPTAAQEWAFADALKAVAMAGGNHSGTMKINNSNTPLDSTYITGDLEINSSFTLAGIVYVKGSISATKEVTITGSGSPIALVAEGGITFEKLGTAGSGDSFIIMSMSTNGIYFKKEATLSALIYAPNGPIYFNKEATITGGIVGADITIKKDASLTYVAKATGFDLPGGLTGRYTVETYTVSRN